MNYDADRFAAAGCSHSTLGQIQNLVVTHFDTKLQEVPFKVVGAYTLSLTITLTATVPLGWPQEGHPGSLPSGVCAPCTWV